MALVHLKFLRQRRFWLVAWCRTLLCGRRGQWVIGMRRAESVGYSLQSHAPQKQNPGRLFITVIMRGSALMIVVCKKSYNGIT